MKYFLVIALGLVFCTNAAAQDKKFELQDVCGSPTTESMLYTVFSGEVVKIIDGDTILFKQSNGKKKTVDLVTVNSGSNDAAAKDFLTKNLLKKKVEVLVSLNSDRERVWGLVRRDNQEINRQMIEQGIAAFQMPESYSFSVYSSCVYRKMEEKAKQEKLGIWAK